MGCQKFTRYRLENLNSKYSQQKKEFSPSKIFTPVLGRGIKITSIFSIQFMYVPIEMVAFLVWDERLASQLRRLRGNQSQRVIARKVTKSGLSCTENYILSLENTEVAIISPAMIKAIVKVLGYELLDFLTNAQ